MHMIIRAVVPAESKEQALSKGKSVFRNLIEWNQFDYYVTFDSDKFEMGGEARYSNLPTAARIDEEEGKELLKKDNWHIPDKVTVSVAYECGHIETTKMSNMRYDEGYTASAMGNVQSAENRLKYLFFSSLIFY